MSENVLRSLRKQQRELKIANLAKQRASSSMSCYTIPKAVDPPQRLRAPPSTQYNPNYDAVRSHSSMAALVPLREPAKRDMTSDPGNYGGKALQAPKTFVSTLSRDRDTRGSAHRSSSSDFLMTPRGLGSRSWKPHGGTISRSKRFDNSSGNATAVSVVDVPPPRHESRGISFGAGPLVRGDVTKVRPFASEPSVSSSFAKCHIPELSFTAARKATSMIERDRDDYGVIDDPSLKEDQRFLKEVREDIRRWNLKSQFA